MILCENHNISTVPKTASQRAAGKPRKSEKGLSNVTHLTARLIIRTRQNGEGQAFILENYDRDFTLPPNPKGRKKGEIIQSGLSSRGKKTVRVISDCYGMLVTNKNGFQDRRELDQDMYNSYCRFITLTFRNIIPDDKTAKKLLDNFFKRLRRKKERSMHYLWVAERQKRGAIHFHILTPEKIVNDENFTTHEVRVLENMWINRAWNEVVCNWAYSAGKITKEDKKLWLNEYSLSESYYNSLSKFRAGKIKRAPRKPAKSKFMLLPNCVHVMYAGRYMAKYMSKENQNIVGGMYDASTLSREFLKERDLVSKDFGVVMLGNEVIKYMYHRAMKCKKYVAMWEVDHNESKGIWCKDGYKLLEWYYDYCELNSIF